MALGSREMLLVMEARDNASDDISRVAGGINQLGNAGRLAGFQLFAAGLILNRLGSGLESIGRRALTMSRDVMQAAMDFDYAMRLVQTQTQGSRKQFRFLSDEALRLSMKFPQSAEQMAEGLYDIFSSIDVTGREAIRILRLSAQAATAGGVDIRTSVRAVIQILNAFDLKVGKTRHVYDVLFQMLRKSTGTYEELVAAFGNVVSAGKMADQTLETLAGSTAFLTTRGRTQAQATISVSRAIDQLTRASNAKKLEDTLGISIFDKATGDYKQLNVVIEEMAHAMEDLTKEEQGEVLQEIFGAGSIQANRFFRLALPQFEKLNKAIQDMKEGKGQLAAAFEVMKAAPAVRMQILRNTIHSIAIDIGTLFLPAFMMAAKVIRGFLKTFNELPDSTKKIIAQFVFFGGIAALVVGKLMSLAGAILSIKSLFLFMGMAGGQAAGFGAAFATVGSILLWFIGIAALVAGAAFLIYKNWDTIKKFLLGLWEEIQPVWEAAKEWLIDTWNTIWETIQFVAGEIWSFVSDIWTELSAWTEEHWAEIEETVTIVAKTIWNVIKANLELIEAIWKAIWPALSEIVRTVWNLIKDEVMAAIHFVQGIIEIVMGVIRGDWEAVWEGIKTVFGAIWEGIVGLGKAMIELLFETLSGVWALIQLGWDAAWEAMASAFSAVWAGIQAVLAVAANVIIAILNTIIAGINATIDAIAFLNPLGGAGVGHVGYIPLVHVGGPATPNEGNNNTPSETGNSFNGRRVRAMSPRNDKGVRDVHLHVEPKHSTVDTDEAVRELDWAMRTSGW